MPRPRLSPEERKQRRREAALKGIRNRATKQATAAAETDVPSARELLDRARALGIHRERGIYRWAHELKAGHHPKDWPWMVRQALLGALEVWEDKR
jgi:hypothetical protein